MPACRGLAFIERTQVAADNLTANMVAMLEQGVRQLQLQFVVVFLCALAVKGLALRTAQITHLAGCGNAVTAWQSVAVAIQQLPRRFPVIFGEGQRYLGPKRATRRFRILLP